MACVTREDLAVEVDQPETSTEAGMATAEYAVATLAAVAFAGLLLAVLTSDSVRAALTDLVMGALQ